MSNPPLFASTTAYPNEIDVALKLVEVVENFRAHQTGLVGKFEKIKIIEDGKEAAFEIRHLPIETGNIGALSFQFCGLARPIEWFAGSKSARRFMKSFIGASGRFAKSHKDGCIVLPELLDGQIITPYHKAKHPDRVQDSEYPLINALACAIKRWGVKHATASLFTERLPCESCTEVLADFCEKNPGIKVKLAYLYDIRYPEFYRQPHNFHNQLKLRNLSIPLDKITFDSITGIISIQPTHDAAPLAFSSKGSFDHLTAGNLCTNSLMGTSSGTLNPGKRFPSQASAGRS
ncbi:MAG: deaminase domain-containing protein [Actinomycetota bacterium]